MHIYTRTSAHTLLPLQLDLLIEYLVADPLKAMWEAIRGSLPFKDRAGVNTKSKHGYMRTDAKSWRTNGINAVAIQGHAVYQGQINRTESADTGEWGSGLMIGYVSCAM